MKKIVLLIALFTGFITVAQEDCPGERIELLKNKKIKVLPLSESLQRLGYKGFYADADLKSIFKRIAKTSDYSALANREFKVLSYERYTNRDVDIKYKLLLANPETGEIYYDYNPDECDAFPFEILGKPEPKQIDYCVTIKTGKTSDGVPYYASRFADGVTFTRYFEAEGTIEAIEVKTNLIPGTLKGLSVQLSNNVKIERTDCDVVTIINGLGGKTQMAVIVLTAAESELLKNNEITKTTIGGTIDTNITKATLLKTYFNCLINKEPLAPAIPKFKASCDKITADLTSVPGEKHYFTPLMNELTLQKVIDKKGGTNYFGVIAVPSNTMHIGKGVMIVFDNDALLSYPDAKVSEKRTSDGNYLYTAAFAIKPEEMKNFVAQHVRGAKVIDIVMPIEQGAEIQKMAQCLVQK